MKKNTIKIPLNVISPIIKNFENTQGLYFCAEGTSASSDTSHKIQRGSSSIKEEVKCSRPNAKNNKLYLFPRVVFPSMDMTGNMKLFTLKYKLMSMNMRLFIYFF